MRWKLIVVAALLLIGAAALRSPSGQVARAQAPHQAGAALRLVAPTGTVSRSGIFDVELHADQLTNLSAFETDVRWDPTVLDLTGFTLSSLVGNIALDCDGSINRCAGLLGPIARGSGAKRLGAFTYGMGQPTSGSGVLALLHFQVRPAAPGGSTTVTLADPVLADSDLNRIVPSVSGATLTIEAASPTPSPTLTATAMPSATATRTPTASATASATAAPSATATATATASPSATATATASPTMAPSATTTATASPSATATPSPSATPTATATATATASATATPTVTATATTTVTATPERHLRYLPLLLRERRFR